MIKLKCVKEFDMEDGNKAPFTKGKYYESRSISGVNSDYYLLTNDDGKDHYMPPMNSLILLNVDGSPNFELVEE